MKRFSRDIRAYSLVAIHVVAVTAGFVAPYSYREQFRHAPSARPTAVTLVDAQGRFRWRPLARLPDGSVTPIRFFVEGSRYRWLGWISSRRHLFGVDEPHRVFFLGTDALGRDNFSRLVYGGQLTLMAGLLATWIALSLAVVTGTIAGYFGRYADTALVWVSDVFLSLPWLYILLAARAFLPLDLAPEAAFLAIVLMLGLLGWAAPMRIVRGIVKTAKHREHVEAARSAGAGHLRVLWRHVLPQTLPSMAVQAALLVPAFMLAEVTLSFVGLGVSEPRPSWGNMLADVARSSMLFEHPWLGAPAFLLVLVTLLYHQMLGGGWRLSRESRHAVLKN